MKRVQNVLVLLFILLFAAILLTQPAMASKSIHNGLLLCANTIIPSLFPFLVLSSFMTTSGLADKIGRLLNPISRLLFNLPGVSGSAIVMGMLGGYPTGARMTAELLELGAIDQGQAKRMLHFCINSGPAFVISAVGYSMLGNKKVGLILFLSLVLSSLVIGIVTGIFSRKKKPDSHLHVQRNTVRPPDMIDSFVLSTANAANAMFSICAWVLVFSAFTSYLVLLPLSLKQDALLSCILEVTGGVSEASGFFSPPFLCGALAFSGLSVHFQIMKYINKIGMKYPQFLLSRLINAVVAGVICEIMLRLFPYDTQVFSNGVAAIANPVSSSIPAAVGLVFMCGILLLEIKNLNPDEKSGKR